MEEDKIMLTGAEFEKALTMTVTEVKEQIRKERSELGDGRRLKSSPLLELIDNGELTKDFIVKELPLIQGKTSRLSLGKRKVLGAIISVAIRKAWAMKAAASRIKNDDENKQ